MTAVAGLRGSGDWGTDERPKNFREFILFRNPNGTAPMFALMARVQKESTNDPEFAWWDEPNDLVRLQVAGALAAGDTIVTVDSVDPTAALPKASWGLAGHLKPGDMLMVEPAADAAAFVHEVLRVVTVLSDTQFTVQRGAAGTTPATIANDLFLLKIGSAYAEGTPSPSSTSRNPVKYSNYTQIFKTPYELTGTAMETHLRTGDPVQNDKKRKSFDHSRDIEFSLLLGQKSETTGDNGKPLRTMDGLRKFIPGTNTTVFSSVTTTSSFLDAASPVFDFDSPAGDSRVCFIGNAALNELNKMVQIDANSQMQFGPIIKQFGMRMRELILPQGSLFLRTHPLLSRHTLYSKSMFIVDFSAIRWRPMKNRDTKFEDNIQARDEDTRKGQWKTEGGLEVRFGGLTCGYLGNIHAA